MRDVSKMDYLVTYLRTNTPIFSEGFSIRELREGITKGDLSEQIILYLEQLRSLRIAFRAYQHLEQAVKEEVGKDVQRLVRVLRDLYVSDKDFDRKHGEMLEIIATQLKEKFGVRLDDNFSQRPPVDKARILMRIISDVEQSCRSTLEEVSESVPKKAPSSELDRALSEAFVAVAEEISKPMRKAPSSVDEMNSKIQTLCRDELLPQLKTFVGKVQEEIQEVTSKQSLQEGYNGKADTKTLVSVTTRMGDIEKNDGEKLTEITAMTHACFACVLGKDFPEEFNTRTLKSRMAYIQRLGNQLGEKIRRQSSGNAQFDAALHDFISTFDKVCCEMNPEKATHVKRFKALLATWPAGSPSFKEGEPLLPQMKAALQYCRNYLPREYSKMLELYGPCRKYDIPESSDEWEIPGFIFSEQHYKTCHDQCVANINQQRVLYRSSAYRQWKRCVDKFVPLHKQLEDCFDQLSRPFGRGPQAIDENKPLRSQIEAAIKCCQGLLRMISDEEESATTPETEQSKADLCSIYEALSKLFSELQQPIVPMKDKSVNALIQQRTVSDTPPQGNQAGCTSTITNKPS